MAPRTLVVCCDGTGNQFDETNTNIVRLFQALDKSQPDRMLAYYQPGVGTYASPDSVQWSLYETIAKWGDLGFAWYLPAHIMGAYRFLMDNYRKGDKICLFGFSRGAYTVRCLAGMLHKVGLLPKANQEQVTFAYRMYADASPAGRKAAQGFRDAFSVEVSIDFVGVWDTVASVGLTFKSLPFTDSNTIIGTFRHAMALDEHRVKFLPNPWKEPPKHPIPPMEKPKYNPFKWIKYIFRSRTLEALNAGNAYEDDGHYHHGKPTDVVEVWFAGCHSDVGGGSIENTTMHTLANNSFKWMLNEIMQNTNIIFKDDVFGTGRTSLRVLLPLTISTSDTNPKLRRPPIPSRFLGNGGGHDQEATAAESISPSTSSDHYAGGGSDKDGPLKLVGIVEENPTEDARAPVVDQLVKNPFWKILEYALMWEYWQDDDGVWHRRLAWHFGKPRKVPGKTPKFHWSVKMRRDSTNWEPAAKLERDAVIEYVDPPTMTAL